MTPEQFNGDFVKRLTDLFPGHGLNAQQLGVWYCELAIFPLEAGLRAIESVYKTTNRKHVFLNEIITQARLACPFEGTTQAITTEEALRRRWIAMKPEHRAWYQAMSEPEVYMWHCYGLLCRANEAYSTTKVIKDGDGFRQVRVSNRQTIEAFRRRYEDSIDAAGYKRS